MVPLTPAVFYILLALFGKERHGYDIMQQVREVSQGA
jgi:DNA-binding PadR family transcriptional regulator